MQCQPADTGDKRARVQDRGRQRGMEITESEDHHTSALVESNRQGAVMGALHSATRQRR